ncbi:hypothetical protein B0O99DRAFT_668732 [Bisporella sp. PMI_857]|nr:hypothetical protein B0O99DRAFT_668732 [Bisporella sp. PMI_857]
MLTFSINSLGFGLLLYQQRPSKVWIEFKICDRTGTWKLANALLVDPSDPSEVKRIAIKYMRKGERMHIFDTNLHATADGTNTILLIPEREIDTDNLLSSVCGKRSDLQTNLEADPSIPEPNAEGFCAIQVVVDLGTNCNMRERSNLGDGPQSRHARSCYSGQ